MTIVAEDVLVRLRADMDGFDRRMKESPLLAERGFAKIRNSSQQMEDTLRKNSATAGNAIKGMAGSIAAYFSGRELAGIIDAFTQFQNKLRVAGVASEEMKSVQDRLFASAQKYGVELGALGGLYGSLSTASKELGVSQEQVFKLTDSVSAALKVQGGSAQEASGALLQLGQALRGGKIQAEEYNSLLDGLFPLLEAAANGSDKFGGSVGRLTAEVKAGKVSSREFFDAILSGSEILEKRAAASALTLSGAYTSLTNAITVYVGQAAQSSGAQAALVQGIKALADNLDVVIPALAVVAGALGVKYVASAGAAAVATLRADAALLGLATRAEVAGFAIGTLARALAINGVILAVTAAIGSFASELARSDALVQQANSSYDEMRRRFEATGEGAQVAGDGSRSVGDGAASAEPKVRSFAGAVGNLADQLYRQAKAARAAKLEMLGNKLAESQSNEVELGRRSNAGRNSEGANLRAGGIFNVRNWPAINRNLAGSVKSWWTGGESDKAMDEAYRRQTKVSADLQAQLNRAKKTPLEDYIAPSGGPATPAGKNSGGKASPDRTADQLQAEQERIQQEIANAQIGYLQELAQTTQNAAERAKLEQQAIEATRAANAKEIGSNDALNSAQREKLLSLNNQVANLRKQQIQQQEDDRLRQQQLSLTNQALRDQDDLLRLQADLADTAKERREIELRRLDIAYRLEQAAIAEELRQAEIAKDTDRMAAARKRLADMEDRRGLETQAVDRANETPGQRYVRQINRTADQINEDIEAIKVDGLQALNSELADAITGAKSLGDVFKNVADQIIGDLLRIAIQQAVIKPLANSLFGGLGSLGGAGGFDVSSIFGGGLFGFSQGGYTGNLPRDKVAGVVHGGEYVMPASAVDRIGVQNLAALASGDTSAARAMTGAAAVSPAAAQQNGTIRVAITMDNDMFTARVQEASVPVAVEVVKANAPGMVQAAKAETLRDLNRQRL
jgi:tape measure domain-containing protein